jgi:hypothetical protein
MILLALICLVLAALLAFRERGAARDRERAAEERAELRREQAEERLRHAEERKNLYQRIQAPDVAVAEAVREARGPYQRRQPKGHDHDIHAPEVNGG